MYKFIKNICINRFYYNLSLVMEEGRSRSKCLINQHFHNPLQELCESPLHAECLQFSVILMAAR